MIGGVFAVAISIPPLLRRRATNFEFTPLNGFPGFRRITGGTVSSVPDFLVGLNEVGTPPPRADRSANPCSALFGAKSWSGAEVPVAFFSDYNCPYCATLEKRLVALVKDGAPIRIIWHEFPLLGPSSVWAAQVALAAGLQGAYAPVHEELMQRVLRPGPSGLRDLAARHGIDADQLLRDAQGEVVARKLDRSIALGHALGIPGTPGTVIGRTLVIGAIKPRDLEQLIEMESSEPFDGCG